MPLGSVCLTKTSLIDYPGKVAAVVFTPGCNLRCPYCHNPGLVDGSIPEDAVSLSDLDAFLDKRKNVLEGVCITGGEPLLHQNLPDLVDLIHYHGLAVKLDTNGMFPQRLAQQHCEFIAMDVKTVPSKYHLVGAESGEPILESIKWILSSGIDHEFRTTLAPGIVDEQDLGEIALLVAGAMTYTLTSFRPGKTLDPAYSGNQPYSRENLEKLAAKIGEKGVAVHLR